MTKVQLNEAGFIEDYYFDPATSTLGDVDGPNVSTDGNLAVFDGITGKKIKDGGTPNQGDVIGPVEAVSGELVAFNGTTGKLVKSGGSIVIKTVSIATASSGTATVIADSVILGFNVTAITGTEHVKTVDISSTTLTVTLTGSDTATVKVAVLQPATPIV